jgi:plastocyanin
VRRDSLNGRAAATAALAAFLAAACSAVPGGSDQARASGTAGPVTVRVATAGGDERRFVPAVVSVPAGAEVRLVFRNESSESHNLSFTGSLEPIRTETIMDPGQEQTLSFVAPAPGVQRFVCTVHVDMSGELRVTGPSPRP